MTTKKFFSRFPGFLLLILLATSLGWACKSSGDKLAKAKDKILKNSDADVSTIDAIYYNDQSAFSGPVPAGIGSTTDTLTLECSLSTNENLGAEGPSFASSVDSVTFDLTVQSTGGLIVSEVTGTEVLFTSECTNGNPPPFGFSHGDWAVVPGSDSTAAIAHGTIEVNGTDCDNPTLKLEGVLIVTLTEGMPDDPGNVSMSNVKAWMGDTEIPAHSVPL